MGGYVYCRWCAGKGCLGCASEFTRPPHHFPKGAVKPRDFKTGDSFECPDGVTATLEARALAHTPAQIDALLAMLPGPHAIMRYKRTGDWSECQRILEAGRKRALALGVTLPPPPPEQEEGKGDLTD